jgi:hypothetical protein
MFDPTDPKDSCRSPPGSDYKDVAATWVLAAAVLMLCALAGALGFLTVTESSAPRFGAIHRASAIDGNSAPAAREVAMLMAPVPSARLNA